ncbi:MAG: pyruvate:ferredoxin (flavodoxin) oxidoreductase, partial [Elusimicrobia bacterium]|nr:pyruvate:ferredoxin (flavodoxin) oxidoreductase [Elusimicrobiota bacterium]
PLVQEMQSEGGAAGSVHGALQTGSLCTTFTASQGLLLMIPNMYKIAGELSAFCMHVAARTLATHALSIFGDHSDAMATRQTGCALLCSSSVQEAHDFAAVAHAASLETRLPFIHFFDGFRTSHEIRDIETLTDEALRALIDREALAAHRARGLTPERPTLRGTTQNPDVFFQSREAANPFYAAAPGLVDAAFKRLGALSGRRYRPFDYVGAPDAESVLVMMGSGCGAAEEAVHALNARGGRTGLLKVRLYRPFDAARFLAALPATARRLAVLDRCKEPGAPAEPLCLDVLAALAEGRARGLANPPEAVGGRYGLGSKEFTPAMAAAALAELRSARPRRGFTLGIEDDVTRLSLPVDAAFDTEKPLTRRAVFFGLGSDGTVGANKQSIKLIAKETGLRAQGYFVYDSKKSGSTTVSHLRFGPDDITSTYLIRSAEFVACHRESLLSRADVVGHCAEGGTLLVNAADLDGLPPRLPPAVAREIARKRLKVFGVDAGRVARDAGLGGKINTVMQACFFELSEVLPGYQAHLHAAAEKAYAAKGAEVVERNRAALDNAVAGLRELRWPGMESFAQKPAARPSGLIDALVAGRGDLLPVSAFAPDGVYPTGTARREKRAIAEEIPVWGPQLCVQCSKCALVCPHAAIRVKAYGEHGLTGAPAEFPSVPWKGRELPADSRYTVQVSPDDCTGCRLCFEVCPAKDKKDPSVRAIMMEPVAPVRARESERWGFFEWLREADLSQAPAATVKHSQLRPPLFEFSGACAGCGETPYLKLLTQLLGDRLLVANATGCSSSVGGNLPPTPWTKGSDGRGPAWSNSLFEDNAEFGLGMRLALDARTAHARALVGELRPRLGDALADGLLGAAREGPEGLEAQRGRIERLRRLLAGDRDARARDLVVLSDALARKSVWIVGGDGWAYDIGFGGLDHVLRSGRDVKVLVLDTEVYSNTGGQASKATPRGAVAKFASEGKKTARKDLAWLAMGIGDVYVARVAMGANDRQAVEVLAEAEAYPGPALVIAYSHCIAHGIDMSQGMSEQKLAVDTGYWPLLRYDPRKPKPLKLESAEGRLDFADYAKREGRYRALVDGDPALLELARKDIVDQWRRLRELQRTPEERAGG